MRKSLVMARTREGSVLFYTGRAGKAWLSADEADALDFGAGEAEHHAQRFQRQYALSGMRFGVIEQAHAYSTCIVRDNGFFALYLMPCGSVRAVPNDRARLRGQREHTFGDREYLRTVIEAGNWPLLQHFTEQGLEFMQGLASCSLQSYRLAFH